MKGILQGCLLVLKAFVRNTVRVPYYPPCALCHKELKSFFPHEYLGILKEESQRMIKQGTSAGALRTTEY
eukprot:6482288-Amphidinium_carterae.1